MKNKIIFLDHWSSKLLFVINLCIFIFFSITISFSNEIDERCPHHVYWGAPKITVDENQITYLCRSGYAVAYKNPLKNSLYVVEHLTATRLGNEVRTNKFKIDYDLKPEYRSTNKDYIQSGFDKGHMSPAGNHSANKISMSESFLLSNIVPQNPKINRGVWKNLEVKVREWVIKDKRDFFIIQGTIFESKYTTIGNQVAVPKSLFKIILDPKNQEIISFIFPNTDVKSKSLKNYISSIHEIENITGIDFFPNISIDLKYIEKKQSALDYWYGID